MSRATTTPPAQTMWTRPLAPRVRSALLAAALWAMTWHAAGTADALPEFAWREVTLTVTLADGKPAGTARVYGFCRELNLTWPRIDEDMQDRNDVVWHESYLGKTGKDGRIKAIVPPGKWAFFAARAPTEAAGPIVAAWSDYQDRKVGDTVALVATKTKRFSLQTEDGQEVAADRLFLKPAKFPIWIPLKLLGPANSLRLDMTAGELQLWAAGSPTSKTPGFVLDWGQLSDQTPDGLIASSGKTATAEFTGGKGSSLLSWFRLGSFGLEGDLPLVEMPRSDSSKVWFSPGEFMLAYRRPIVANLIGDFVGQRYDLTGGKPAPPAVGYAARRRRRPRALGPGQEDAELGVLRPALYRRWQRTRPGRTVGRLAAPGERESRDHRRW